MATLLSFPWLSIFAFLLTYFTQKKKGKSNAAALLTGAAVGAGTYYLADPSNPNNLLGFGVGSSGAPTPDTDQTVPGGATTASAIGSTVSSVVDSAGKVLSSWGPAGTAGVIGVAANASSIGKYLPWLLVAFGAYIITK